MADARPLRHELADGLVRDRGATRGRGHDDERPLPVAPTLTLYHATDCRLCERALEVVRDVRVEVEFELELVDIGGDAELERRYREHLPVIEIDGERAFVYFVDPDTLRERLRAR